MSTVRGYPEGVPAFDTDALWERMRDYFEKWALFETIKPRHRRYTCTHCGYVWEHDAKALRDIDTPYDLYWDRVNDNDKISCPKCNRILYVKNRKRFMPPNASKAVAVFVPVTRDDVWVRCFFFEKDYSKSDTTVWMREDEIYRLQPGKAEMWGKYNGYTMSEHFDRRTRIIEPFSYNHGAWCEKYTYKTDWIERDGIRDLSDTFLRYSAWDIYARQFPYDTPLMKYLAAYARHPQMEVLCKVGLFDAVHELVERGAENKRVMDWDAKTPWGMHRLTKPEYKVWLSPGYHADLQVLKLYKRIRGKSERDFETAKLLLETVDGLKEAEHLIVIARKASRTPQEVVRYFERIAEENNATACRWGYVTVTRIYNQWCDWRRMLEREGADLAKINPFPRDLKAEHDAAVRRAEKRRAKQDMETKRKLIEAQEIKYKDVTEIYAKIRDKYTYDNGVYAIVVPENASAVIEEGIRLHHCAGTSDRYFERVRRRETFVLFLRKVSNVNKSWYTLEVEPGGTIRQKRTKNDEQLPDLQAAEPFLREWQEVIAKRMTGEDIAAAMAAKRLRIAEMEELARTGTTVKFGSLRGKKLYDVLSADLMEQVYSAKTGGEIMTEANEREEKQA